MKEFLNKFSHRQLNCAAAGAVGLVIVGIGTLGFAGGMGCGKVTVNYKNICEHLDNLEKAKSREDLLSALNDIGDFEADGARAVTPIIEVIKNEKDAEVRSSALTTLLKISGEDGSDRAFELLQDSKLGLTGEDHTKLMRIALSEGTPQKIIERYKSIVQASPSTVLSAVDLALGGLLEKVAKEQPDQRNEELNKHLFIDLLLWTARYRGPTGEKNPPEQILAARVLSLVGIASAVNTMSKLWLSALDPEAQELWKRTEQFLNNQSPQPAPVKRRYREVSVNNKLERIEYLDENDKVVESYTAAQLEAQKKEAAQVASREIVAILNQIDQLPQELSNELSNEKIGTRLTLKRFEPIVDALIAATNPQELLRRDKQILRTERGTEQLSKAWASISRLARFVTQALAIKSNGVEGLPAANKELADEIAALALEQIKSSNEALKPIARETALSLIGQSDKHNDELLKLIATDMLSPSSTELEFQESLARVRQMYQAKVLSGTSYSALLKQVSSRALASESGSQVSLEIMELFENGDLSKSEYLSMAVNVLSSDDSDAYSNFAVHLETFLGTDKLPWSDFKAEVFTKLDNSPTPEFEKRAFDFLREGLDGGKFNPEESQQIVSRALKTNGDQLDRDSWLSLMVGGSALAGENRTKSKAQFTDAWVVSNLVEAATHSTDGKLLAKVVPYLRKADALKLLDDQGKLLVERKAIYICRSNECEPKALELAKGYFMDRSRSDLLDLYSELRTSHPEAWVREFFRQVLERIDLSKGRFEITSGEKVLKLRPRAQLKETDVEGMVGAVAKGTKPGLGFILIGDYELIGQLRKLKPAQLDGSFEIGAISRDGKLTAKAVFPLDMNEDLGERLSCGWSTCPAITIVTAGTLPPEGSEMKADWASFQMLDSNWIRKGLDKIERATQPQKE